MKTSVKTSIIPYKNFILVRKEVITATVSGFLLSEASQQAASFGEVIGSGKELAGDIKFGDKLMFTDYSGFELNDKTIKELGSDELKDGYTYHLINEDDVLMVVRSARG